MDTQEVLRVKLKEYNLDEMRTLAAELYSDGVMFKKLYVLKESMLEKSEAHVESLKKVFREESNKNDLLEDSVKELKKEVDNLCS